MIFLFSGQIRAFPFIAGLGDGPTMTAKSSGKDGEGSGRGGFLAGWEQFADDSGGVGQEAVAPAVVYVSVEDVPGFGAESGISHDADAVHSIGPGLFLGDGDVPQLNYVVCNLFEATMGDHQGQLALEGIDLAACGGKGDSRAGQV